MITSIPLKYVPKFNALAGLSPSLPFTSRIPMIEAIIPNPEIKSGSIAPLTGSIVNSAPNSGATEGITTASAIAEIIEPTYDSKRSDPIPATSPTLSPTLSAITAGFLGSSSGIPASTLPTRSAPTSAAFV